MDGQVGRIRAALDAAGFVDTAILAYSAKYASGLYGPFRDAVDVTIVGGGDRKGYQQDWRNGREALREIAADVDQGADMVMVKPASPTSTSSPQRAALVDVPLAAYHVSGEYAMIKAAAANGWIDHDAVALEHLTAIKRAGADVILTYLARWFAETRDEDVMRSPATQAVVAASSLALGRSHARSRRMIAYCDAMACAAAGCDPVLCRGAGVASNDDAVRPLGARHPGRRQLVDPGVQVGRRHARTSWPAPKGAYVFDVEGRRYIDLVQSYGAVILGHAHPAVTAAVQQAAADGTSYGAPTPREMKLAEAIAARVPSCERVRLMNSGTEATSTAVRLARGFTGRDRIVIFHGNFHGATDALLAAGGSGVATLGLPGTAGVPAGAVAETLVVPYNQVPVLDERVAARARRAGRREHGRRRAAARVSSPGCAPSAIGSARCSCSTRSSPGSGSAPGGAQAKYDVTPTSRRSAR